MVEIAINGDRLVLEMEGLDKLWALKSRMEIPLANISGVHSADPDVARGWWKSIKIAGTYIPGLIIAGTFERQRKRVFWDVESAEKAIVIDLVDDRYDELVVEVGDPQAAVTQIQAALSARDARAARVVGGEG
jgi:hypothetical protein